MVFRSTRSAVISKSDVFCSIGLSLRFCMNVFIHMIASSQMEPKLNVAGSCTSVGRFCGAVLAAAG
ncbi:hypothetical protein PMI24_03543 [Pseudomonas sp. GM25]|nr:hypothetical protein PMI24_03543 [Pseudomonas sp. GM25]